MGAINLEISERRPGMDLSNGYVFNQSEPPLENDMDCKLPWEDYVETNKDSKVDIVILVCLLLTLFFDTFLIAIILAHDDLRKKRVNLFMMSICISDMSFALYLIALVQPGVRFKIMIKSVLCNLTRLQRRKICRLCE